MPFRYTTNDMGKTQLVLEGEPDYVVALASSPSGLEDELKQSKWIVVCMAEWSIHDLKAGHRTIKLVAPYSDRVKLGLRLYDYPQEHTTWVPDPVTVLTGDQADIVASEQNGIREVTITGRADASPLWVTFSGGHVVSIRHGQLSDTEMEGLIDQLLEEVGNGSRR
ncbi:hypothetical protein [Tuwongella immobilis]|uniref:Uncharacterized protein n=1 Tax=Tuwongella immobilis TaxID=692036 RepID=A0A6C2YJ71_9BACT|nr:hypothetical protein [Tuwongella immobilis]VIP01289.1 unnamed protein product [Tuwongella immobilis]VTR98004.1 unnamed protein product [Tuwongella immobilis]